MEPSQRPIWSRCLASGIELAGKQLSWRMGSCKVSCFLEDAVGQAQRIKAAAIQETQERMKPRAGRTRPTSSSSCSCGTSRWTSSVERGSHSTGTTLAPYSEPQRHGGPASGEDQTINRDALECGPCQSCLSDSTQGENHWQLLRHPAHNPRSLHG